MGIQTVGGMNNVIKQADVNKWVENKRTNRDFDIELKDLDFNKIVKESPNSFGEYLANSISKVNILQQDANKAMEALAAGKTDNLHETLLKVEEAQIAFKSMNQIRLKVIDAYKEVMKMQV